MAMIVGIQMTLVALAMDQMSFGENSHLGTWPFNPYIPACNPSPAPSTTSCLLRSEPVVRRRDDYRYTPGIGGHKLHTQAVPWNEARMICEDEGGHLAIINSFAEANAISELFRNSPPIVGSPSSNVASIGFHDLYSDGQFVTIHGQSLAKAGYTQWESGEPNNSGGAENCGSFFQTGRLNDIKCGVKHGFICEIPID